MLDGEISKYVDIFTRRCTGMYTITQSIQDKYVVMT